jgi:hypothetical protein
MTTDHKFIIGKPFHDRTALETLMSGERQAMEELGAAALSMAGVADLIDERFAVIEARLTAIEAKLARDLGGQANEAVPGGARVGGVVSSTPRHPDIEQLPQDRDAEGGAVETGGQVSLSASGGTAPQRDDG